MCREENALKQPPEVPPAPPHPPRKDEKTGLISGHRQPAPLEKGGGSGSRMLDYGPGWEARPEQQQ